MEEKNPHEPKVHELKCETEYFALVFYGIKRFEIRKNDRDFQVGDKITLREFAEGEYTGASIPNLTITYILHGPVYGIEEGYCILNW
jgi:hypothetical protein